MNYEAAQKIGDYGEKLIKSLCPLWDFANTDYYDFHTSNGLPAEIKTTMSEKRFQMKGGQVEYIRHEEGLFIFIDLSGRKLYVLWAVKLALFATRSSIALNTVKKLSHITVNLKEL